MHSPILRNKIVSKAIILVLVMAIATPPAAFAETQEECEARKAQAIADATSEVANAAAEVAAKAAKVADAALVAMEAKQRYDACPKRPRLRKLRLGRAALAAKAALDAAIAELKSAMDDLKEAWEALSEALAIECDCEE
jgi:hypothetical protein